MNCVSLGLVNPKSATNVAGILRACGCFGATSLFYTGNRFRYAKDYRADTKNTRFKIPNIGVEDLIAVKPQGAKLIVVELVEGAQPLPQFTHPDNAYYILGPEDSTVPQEIINQADDVVYIPTNNSLNLAATVNVLLYDRLAKSAVTANDELIKRSRDNNNNTITHKR